MMNLKEQLHFHLLIHQKKMEEEIKKHVGEYRPEVYNDDKFGKLFYIKLDKKIEKKPKNK